MNLFISYKCIQNTQSGKNRGSLRGPQVIFVCDPLAVTLTQTVNELKDAKMPSRLEVIYGLEGNSRRVCYYE